MALESELANEATNILRLHWSIRNGSKVPESDEVSIGNEGIKLDAAILSSDLSDSLLWAQKGPPEFAAELYKLFLRSANRVITGNHGSIVAFDSGRFMAVFSGPAKSSHAMKSALQIHFVSEKILTPRLVERYPSYGFPISYGIGIDVSPILVVRSGIRGSDDLLWVGRAPDLAARLSALRTGPPAACVTSDVFEGAHHSSKISGGGNRFSDVGADRPTCARSACISVWVELADLASKGTLSAPVEGHHNWSSVQFLLHPAGSIVS